MENGEQWQNYDNLLYEFVKSLELELKPEKPVHLNYGDGCRSCKVRQRGHGAIWARNPRKAIGGLITRSVSQISQGKIRARKPRKASHGYFDLSFRRFQPMVASSFQGNFYDHLKIQLSDIMLATENFSDAYHIGHEEYCDLYRAELEHVDQEKIPCVSGKNIIRELPRRRSTVLIKRILRGEDKGGEKLFFTEIEMLTTCNHRNIVTLLGVCNEGFERILVFEHAFNGYLNDYLINTKDKRPILTWVARLKICLGVAYALRYLHYEMEDNKMIIHRDIRSNTIALDENWGAKICDFRYSLSLCQYYQGDEALCLEWVVGDRSYVDPEYETNGYLKRESDVYSLGVVFCEILCGRIADGLASEVSTGSFHNGTIQEMIDPVIMEERDDNHFTLKRGPNEESLVTFLGLTKKCVNPFQAYRPTIKVVVEELEKALYFEENNQDDPKIPLEDIIIATQNFHDDNIVGEGGFGNVYKGKLPQGDNTIVAKRLDTRGGQGERQFRSELQVLFEYKHQNIISLVGYCDEEDAKIIVFEYAPRGSLDRYVSDARLNWMNRLNICIKVANALKFLHKGFKKVSVIHRDIKAANILLTDDWNAKLADFGLSLISVIHQETEYVIDHACGTQGYVDPLYLKSGFLTKESDIYSFGVVLFEILCGRSTFEIHKREGMYLASFVKHNFENGKRDEVVFEEIKAQIMPEALTAFQTIAYQCLHDDREERPKAKEVAEQLKKALELQKSGADEASTKTSTSYQLQD